MIKIDYLKNHSKFIPELAKIWHEVLGSIWFPDIEISAVIEKLQGHMNFDSFPITFVAMQDDQNQSIGMCSLRENDGIRPDLKPWLGGLVVDKNYQNQGIGKTLIDVVKNKAKEMNFKTLYLFAIDQNVVPIYEHLGWIKIGIEKFKNYDVTVMKIDL